MGRLKKHNKKGGAQCPVFVFACQKGRRQVFESVFFPYSYGFIKMSGIMTEMFFTG